MTQPMNRTRATPTAKAAAMSRATIISSALSTLILSVILGLLSGAVWMHAT